MRYTAEQVRATVLVLNDRMPSNHPAIKQLEAYAAMLEAPESLTIIFGEGGIQVQTGARAGAPAVFLSEIYPRGIAGEDVPDGYPENFARVALTFPTAAQAERVADHLCNKLHPPLPDDLARDAGDFTAWFEREVPPGTVISNPRWWAKKILRRISVKEQGHE